MTKLHKFGHLFIIPGIVVLGIITGLVAHFSFHNTPLANLIWLSVTIIGSFKLLKDTLSALLARQFALDYIALLAITVAIIAGQYLVAAVITLMLAGGNTLEEYALELAKSSLTALANRIPQSVTVMKNDTSSVKHIGEIQVGETILIRKGEVAPLDGTLLSEHALFDESSLTGEPYEMDKRAGDAIRSGTVNIGPVVTITVTKREVDSTYKKIVTMVQAAQDEKAPLIRLADKYSTIFTLITFAIGLLAYIISGYDIHRVLAVLVIATPCPLILATPIALMGGMNAAARRRIIFKRLGSLEVLSRVNALVFDKTGTITVGKPEVVDLQIIDKNFDKDTILGLTGALEHNSLHPIAKALVAYAKAHTKNVVSVTHITEELGVGITGTYQGHEYLLGKAQGQDGMVIELSHNNKPIAHFHLQDLMKKDSGTLLNTFHSMGLHMAMFTGDKRENTIAVKAALPFLDVVAEAKPEDKKNGIGELKKQGLVTAMIGDGINDAPALAYADVGMVFSNEESTASTEAADVIFLGGDMEQVKTTLDISQKTIHIAMQSILAGIGISTVGMVIAAFGHIPPIVGAFVQEGIDIAVILNALRTSRL